jgi:hypothetical protein
MTPGRGDALRRNGHGPGRDRRRALSLRMATGRRGRPADRDMSRCRCEAQAGAGSMRSSRSPWTNLEAPQLAAGSHLHRSVMRSSALGRTPCLQVVRCGSGSEDGADACSSAEGRVSLFRLTSRDRYTSPNQAYGTPISAEALAAAAAWGPVRCRSACGHARSLAVMPAARTWAVSSAFGRRVASPEATRRCPSVALRGRAPNRHSWRLARRPARGRSPARRSPERPLYGPDSARSVQIRPQLVVAHSQG